MIFSVNNLQLIDKSLINLIVIVLLVFIVKKVYNLIKFLNHYCKFPRDVNCSYLFGDVIKLLPDYWNTELATYQFNTTNFFVRTASDHQAKSGLYVIWISWSPLVFLCDYKCVEILMSKNSISKPAFYKFIGLKEGLVTSKGDKWKMRRKMIEPFFVSKQQKNFILTIDQVFGSLINEELVKLSHKGKPLNLAEHIHSSTCDIIFQVTLNMPVDTNKEDKVHMIKTIEVMESVTMARIFNPLIWNDRLFRTTKLGKENYQMTNKVYRFFDSSVKQIFDHNSNAINGQENNNRSSSSNFVDLLMSSNKGKIDSEGISEELFTTVAAGHETTATGLNWTLFILGNRLDIQDKLYQEITSMFPDNEPVNDIEKVNQCEYLDKCIKESMRLYPPIPLIGRDLDESIDMNGYRLLAGTTVVCNIFGIHRDPRIYPNPSQYNPERFDSSNITDIPKGAYLPFGVSPRYCIGYRFALIEMKVFLIHIIRRFEILSVKKLEDVSVIIEFALKPSCPLEIMLHERVNL